MIQARQHSGHTIDRGTAAIARAASVVGARSARYRFIQTERPAGPASGKVRAPLFPTDADHQANHALLRLMETIRDAAGKTITEITLRRAPEDIDGIANYSRFPADFLGLSRRMQTFA